MSDLLDIESLGRSGLEELHTLTDTMVEVSSRPIPKSPALRGRTVVSCFFEDSTRTRLSFEAAAPPVGRRDGVLIGQLVDEQGRVGARHDYDDRRHAG